jgi:hypothetical protein
VIRIAPKPSRLTLRSPPIENVVVMLDCAAAITSFGKPPAKTIAPPVVVARKNFRRVMVEVRPLSVCLNPFTFGARLHGWGDSSLFTFSPDFSVPAQNAWPLLRIHPCQGREHFFLLPKIPIGRALVPASR